MLLWGEFFCENPKKLKILLRNSKLDKVKKYAIFEKNVRLLNVKKTRCRLWFCHEFCVLMRYFCSEQYFGFWSEFSVCYRIYVSKSNFLFQTEFAVPKQNLLFWTAFLLQAEFSAWNRICCSKQNLQVQTEIAVPSCSNFFLPQANFAIVEKIFCFKQNFMFQTECSEQRVTCFQIFRVLCESNQWINLQKFLANQQSIDDLLTE